MHLDTNIPLIFSVPDGKRNSVSKTPVAALDIYPTLVELNGLQKPNHLDGKSITTLLDNPDNQKERVVFIIFLDFEILDRLFSLSSGTGTTPTLVSMVQKGKLAA